MNKSITIGRWTKDLELAYIPGSGLAIARGTLAVDRKVAKGKEKVADFIPVVMFGAIAENTVQHCGLKGNKVAISGHLQSGKYQDKKHQEVTHYTLDLIADEIEWLETKKSNTDAKSYLENQGLDVQDGDNMTPVDDGEIPF